MGARKRKDDRTPGTEAGRCLCPKSAVRAVPARLLLLCLLLRSSWLTVEGGRQVGAARVLHCRGGRVAAAVSVGVAGGVFIAAPTRGPTELVLRAAAALAGVRLTGETEQAESSCGPILLLTQTMQACRCCESAGLSDS